MNQALKIALICAAVFVGIGLILLIAAVSTAAFHGEGLFQSVDLNDRTEIVSENFTNLEIHVAASDIRLVSAVDGKVSVTLHEMKDNPHQIEVRGDTLVINQTDTRAWWQKIGFFRFGVLSELSVTVALPEAEYQSLQVSTASGDLAVPDAFTFAEAELDTASGDLLYSAETQKKLKITTASGDVKLACDVQDATVQATSGDLEITGVSGQKLFAKSVSGEVELKSCRITDSLEVKTTSGEIELQEIAGGSDCIVSTTSGEITLEEATDFQTLSLKSVSGDQVLMRCDARELELHSTSGNISATLLSSKTFITSSVSGSISTPTPDPAGGSCRASTVSGNIRIQIV